MSGLVYFKEVEKEFNDRMEGRAVAHYTEVRKNNGVILHGITVRCEESNVAPTIYLDGYYDEAEDTGIEVDDVVRDVIRIYDKHRVKRKLNLEYINDFEKVKDNIEMKLIHTRRNIEILDETPNVPFLDLSIVFFLRVEEPGMGLGTILIKKEMMECWGVNEEELLKIATHNTKENNPISFVHICTVLKSLTSNEMLRRFWDDMTEESMPLYVATNADKMYGAAAMLYSEDIGEFANQIDEDLYILPSSVHELIFVPARCTDPLTLKEMVVSVNTTQLGEDIILSDSVYYYCRENKRVSRVA